MNDFLRFWSRDLNRRIDRTIDERGFQCRECLDTGEIIINEYDDLDYCSCEKGQELRHKREGNE